MAQACTTATAQQSVPTAGAVDAASTQFDIAQPMFLVEDITRVVSPTPSSSTRGRGARGGNHGSRSSRGDGVAIGDSVGHQVSSVQSTVPTIMSGFLTGPTTVTDAPVCEFAFFWHSITAQLF